MANEIHFDYVTGETLYYLIRNTAGQVNITAGNTFENYVGANIATYDNALAENGDGGGHYVGSFNANVTSAAKYYIQVFLQAGGSPADGDSVIGSGTIEWDGSAEKFLTYMTTPVDPVTALENINLHKLMKTAIAGPNLTTSDVASDSVLAHIISKSAGTDVTAFRNTTDSLEAIKDAQQGACQAAIETNNLDHLMKVACTATDVVDTSALAYIAADGGDWSDFLGGSYSLEDIKNGQATALSDINLHKLMYYACASGDVKNNSALAQIAAKTQHWSDFDYSTDSLQAIRDTSSTGSAVPEITD